MLTVRQFTQVVCKNVSPIAVTILAAFICASSISARESVPPDRCRTGTPDSLAANVPAALVKSVIADPERKLADLVSYLAKGSADPFLTVKRIHDWIVLNIVYDTSVPYGGKPPQQIWPSVLAERKGVCSGYANLFREMTKLAGFACESVAGYARGIDYDLFTEAQAMSDNHAWNVITIGEGKYFVDCTWDAGIINQSGFTPGIPRRSSFPGPKRWCIPITPRTHPFSFSPSRSLRMNS